MNWDIISGEWRELRGKVRAKWGKLTDNDLEVIGGKKETLIGRLQQRYGMARSRGERGRRVHEVGVSLLSARAGRLRHGAKLEHRLARAPPKTEDPPVRRQERDGPEQVARGLDHDQRQRVVGSASRQVAQPPQ